MKQDLVSAAGSVCVCVCVCARARARVHMHASSASPPRWKEVAVSRVGKECIIVLEKSVSSNERQGSYGSGWQKWLALWLGSNSSRWEKVMLNSIHLAF
jgi:hypothetical protein